MNWLAHLVLSEPTPAFRVGNVLADLLPITELRTLPDPIQAGIKRHREIDRYTDSHPIVRQSIGRIAPPFRRFAPVVTDIFYDHFLTAAWHQYCTDDIENFVQRFYDDVEFCRNDIPSDAYKLLQRMRAGQWLTSYRDIDGVRLTLNRMSRRLRKSFDLGAATIELERHYVELTADFAEFFPQIRRHFA